MGRGRDILLDILARGARLDCHLPLSPLGSLYSLNGDSAEKRWNGSTGVTEFPHGSRPGDPDRPL